MLGNEDSLAASRRDDGGSVIGRNEILRLVEAARPESQLNTIVRLSIPVYARLSEACLPPDANAEQGQPLETAMALSAEV